MKGSGLISLARNPIYCFDVVMGSYGALQSPRCAGLTVVGLTLAVKHNRWYNRRHD